MSDEYNPVKEALQGVDRSRLKILRPDDRDSWRGYRSDNWHKDPTKRRYVAAKGLMIWLVSFHRGKQALRDLS